jgi:prepilin-type N-terminal cleavage/methylation domain-containing protein
MQRNQEQLWFSVNRQAMTLVELLVVCAIIGILAVLTLVVVNQVTTSAKVAKTRATIQKIDAAMQEIVESYEGKFSVIKRRVARDFPGPDFTDEDRQEIAAHLIRDLMRMEMPQNWGEVNAEPIEITRKDTKTGGRESPLRIYYQKEYDRVTNNGGKSEEPLDKEAFRAALLFLVIQNLNPEALEAFHGSEVADTNGDGLLEFVDAWGKPIQFLRWAPAFSDSDLQQNVLKKAGYTPTNRDANRSWWSIRGIDLQTAMEDASMEHPDLLDERVNRVSDVVGWFLFPLIYSAGPDGKYGIDDGEEGGEKPPVLEAGEILDPFGFPWGMPDGTKSHFDNIHNHRWYKSF